MSSRAAATAGLSVLWRVCPGLRRVPQRRSSSVAPARSPQSPGSQPGPRGLDSDTAPGTWCVCVRILGVFIRLLLTPAIQYRQTSFSQILWFVFSQIVPKFTDTVFFFLFTNCRFVAPLCRASLLRPSSQQHLLTSHLCHSLVILTLFQTFFII